MDLTDHQWRLLEPLFNDDTPQASRGRPPLNPRPILDGILWKMRHAAPWEKLPACYPSHITCYRRYRIWSRDDRLQQAFLTLYKDLLHRGRFDLQRSLREGTITVSRDDTQFRILVSTDLLESGFTPAGFFAGQLSTALVFIQIAISRLKKLATVL